MALQLSISSTRILATALSTTPRGRTNPTDLLLSTADHITTNARIPATLRIYKRNKSAACNIGY